MVRTAAVRGRGNDLGLRDRTPHVRHFFGALVDEQDDEVDSRIVLRDGKPDLFEQDRLAGLGSGDDEAALASSDRSDQIHDP